jgi:arylsulfatase A-like enzyme
MSITTALLTLRSTCVAILLATCIFLIPIQFSRAAAPAKKPNVLLMMVDDMGWSDLGCYGSEIETPNLDRLAAKGLRFSQFYNTAKCSQTRASLLSGLYHPEVGVMKMSNCWTLGDAMRTGGYNTIMTGKWHLNSQPTERGFDKYFGHLSGACNFFTGDNTFRLNGKPFSVPKQNFYTTDANVEYAVKFLDEVEQSDKLFFCYVAFNAPHYPLQAPKETVEKYLGKYMIGWDKLREQRYAKQKKLGILGTQWKLSPRPKDVPAWDNLSDAKKQEEDMRMAAFAAMIDRVDQNIGILLKHLEKQGKLDNTLVLFLSDNGGCPFERTRGRDKKPWDPTSYWTYDKGWAHACNTPFRLYKQNQHEGGISTPLIVNWPGQLKTAPGAITHQPGHLVDIMATMLDVTGAKYPATFREQKLKPLRGKSLLPIFAGKQREQHEALYFDFAGKHQAIRMGKWKLVAAKRGKWELYDMEKDRTELNNLAAAHPDRAKEMKQTWEKWATQVGASKPKSKKNQGKGKASNKTNKASK